MEFQYGKLPHDTTSITTIYDRAVANFNYKSFRISTTLEQFQTPTEESSYLRISQFSLRYKAAPFEIKLGNFYETIGRGLLLRSFEIPGAILEDLSYRSRHYFNRDILGIIAKYRHKSFYTKILFGRPLNYVFPPTQDNKNRRPDTIGAVFVEHSINKQLLGLSTMYHLNGGDSQIYSMATMSGYISNDLSYYTEMAKNVSDFNVDDFSDKSSYAFYGGLNFAFNNFGISTEFKKYNKFLIGAGINEPPSLVKEHSYRVLNRSTHVPQPTNESGYQFELFYAFSNLSTLTVNNTLAKNVFGDIFKFREYFVEYDFTIDDRHDIKIFMDYAEDPFKIEEQRISAGAYADWKIFELSSLKTYFESQTFTRIGENYQNYVMVLGYALKSKFIFNIESEYSNDSFIIYGNSKIWVGASVKYQINSGNSLQLFVGERRGGPACNAGVCYEVLDFNGVELRLSSRF